MKKIVFFVTSAVCICIMYYFPHIMISPGDILQAHQSIKNDCFQCHSVFEGISDEKCTTCHTVSEIGKKEMKNSVVGGEKQEQVLFHTLLKNQKCSSCHSEHNGLLETKLDSEFSHDLLSDAIKPQCNNCHVKPTDERHQSLSFQCASCHNTTGWKSDVKFNHAMILNADRENCVSCHQKPIDETHKDFSVACGTCHTTEKWIPATFNHSSYFALDRDHNVKCAICHTTPNNFKRYTCYGCHEHSEASIRSEHEEEGISNLNDCASCHKSGNKHDIRGGREGKHDDDESRLDVVNPNQRILNESAVILLANKLLKTH